MAVDTPGDAGPFQRAASGDGEAIGSLLAGHAAAIRRAIARDLPHRHRAVLGEDDVLQQTWVDAFHGFGAFARTLSGWGRAREGEAALGAWLLILARRNVLDAVRMLDADKRGGRRPRSQHQDLLDALTDGRLSRSPSRASALARPGRRWSGPCRYSRMPTASS
jgi:DNA-directed RNA polymerase specialized sigma24 family protein